MLSRLRAGMLLTRPQEKLENKLLVFIKQSLQKVRAIHCLLDTFSEFASGPPTQAKAHQELLHKEYVREMAGVGTIGETATISKGINLERDQYVHHFKKDFQVH
jgi:hypothetical protein